MRFVCSSIDRLNFFLVFSGGDAADTRDREIRKTRKTLEIVLDSERAFATEKF